MTDKTITYSISTASLHWQTASIMKDIYKHTPATTTSSSITLIKTIESVGQLNLTLHNHSTAFMHGYTVEMTVERSEHVRDLLLKTVVGMIVKADWQVQEEIALAEGVFGKEEAVEDSEEDDGEENLDSDGEEDEDEDLDPDLWNWKERCAQVLEALVDRMP